MKYAKLDNEVSTNQVILWQYDKAANLIALIKKWNEFAKASTQDFWDYFYDFIYNIDTADSFGLDTWGRILGIPRPTVAQESGYVNPLGDSVFRRLLKARFFFMVRRPTADNYNTYLDILFPSRSYEVYDNRVSDKGTVLKFLASEGDNLVFTITGSAYYWQINVSGYDTSKWLIAQTVLMKKEATKFYIYLASADQKTNYGAIYCILNHGGCKVIDGMNMSIGFTFPKNATDEEAYLIFRHYNLVYQFPAGIRTNGHYQETDKVIGLNDGSSGQDMKNFANAFSWASDTTTNGGIFSTTEGSNYKTDPVASGKAYVVSPSEDNLAQSIVFSGEGRVWLDWGDGDGQYEDLKADSLTRSHTYSQAGLYAVSVYYDSSLGSMVTTAPSATTTTYNL